jgi:hypothetical protein
VLEAELGGHVLHRDAAPAGQPGEQVQLDRRGERLEAVEARR